MSRYKIDVNKKYGMLTPIKISKREKKNTYWLCRCDCGNLTELPQGYLGSYRIVSCGCLSGKVCGNLEPTKEIIEGRLHKKYLKLFDKCKREKYCLEKGIKVCPEWSDKENGFNNFYEWCLNNGYRIDLTIDRIDTFGDYAPNNCRFIDKKGQTRNRAVTVKIIIDGIEKSLAEWCEIYDVPYSKAYNRYRRGSPIKDIFNKNDLRKINKV